LNTSIRNNIYDFISNLLKTIVKISNDSPASVSTGGLDSNPTGVISIPPNDIVGGTPPTISPFTFPSLDFLLEAIEEGLNWFF